LLSFSGMDGNDMAWPIDWARLIHPLIGPVPALGVYAEVAKGVIRGWTGTKHKQYRKFVCGQRQAMGYLTRYSAWRSGKQLNLSRNQLRIMMSFVIYKFISLQAWTFGLREVEVSRNSRYSTHEGGKVVSPKHPPLLAPRRQAWYSFLSEAESTPGP